MALLVGALYSGSRGTSTQTAVSDRTGALFFVLVNQAFSAMAPPYLLKNGASLSTKDVGGRIRQKITSRQVVSGAADSGRRGATIRRHGLRHGGLRVSVLVGGHCASWPWRRS